jgi:hypothetical protein
MPNQATTLIVRSIGWRRLKALIGLVLMALAGCFGPPTMHYDIQEYNKQVVSSEKQMLLYNIGALHIRQPPHFMMVSSVSQTRMFSASTSFQWMTNPSIWTAGPFTAGGVENPTITFVPIQGQDFAQRFESPLTDKFSVFFEDLNWSAPREDLANLVDLFAESLDLTHGDSDKCKAGYYRNRLPTPQDQKDTDPEPHYYANGFSECVEEITKTQGLDVEQIDGGHTVPTKASDDPKAADLVTALQAGYKWAKNGDKFELTNPVRMPAWFDYTPDFGKAPEKPYSSPVLWVEKRPSNLRWQGLQYTLPKGYSWKAYKVNRHDGKGVKRLYALVPDDSDLEHYGNGELRLDKDGNPIILEVKAKEPSEDVRFSYANEVIDEQWPFPYDMVYVEFRHGMVDNDAAERLCFSKPDSSKSNGKDQNGLICGYFKIGNLLQIMQRLADMACPYQDEKSIEANCPQSIFGIGDSIPAWAENSAPYQHITGPYVYVPAHNP